jgi:hypothetical protein
MTWLSVGAACFSEELVESEGLDKTGGLDESEASEELVEWLFEASGEFSSPLSSLDQAEVICRKARSISLAKAFAVPVGRESR